MIHASRPATGAAPVAFGIHVGFVVAVVAAFYAIGFGGFWLGDDFANIAYLHDLEQEGRLLPGTLAYFRPLRPMLAHTAESVTEALAGFAGRAAVEEKQVVGATVRRAHNELAHRDAA